MNKYVRPLLHRKRDEEICNLVIAGATMTNVAGQFGITRERVRQIVLRDTSRTGREIHKATKDAKEQRRIDLDFRDATTATIKNDWRCGVCGGWNIRRGYSYIRGKRNYLPYERCSQECSELFGKLRFRFDRDTYNQYQARSILLRGGTDKHQERHASNILAGINVAYTERYYTQAGSKNEIAMERVASLRKALGTEHLFDDSFPIRVLIVS